MVLTGQAQPESGKQGAAGAQPVQGVVTRAASSSLGWRGWGPRRAQPGRCQQGPWDPPYSGSSREGGFSHNQQSAPHSGPLLDCFLLTCFLLQQVPLHGPPGSAHGDLVSTGPSDRGRHRCPLRSFPIAALREGAGETPVFKAPSQSTTLLPSEGYKPGSSYPGSLESWCLLG